MNRYSYVVVIALCLFSLPVVSGQLSGAKQEEVTPSITFNRDNSVFGIKGGQLYAYVDLARDAATLQKLDSEALTQIILDASRKAALEWWKSPRFSELDSGVVDVITILDKDEYAKADFSSALMHGKVYLKRRKNDVIVERDTLEFDSLRNVKLK